MRSFVSLLFAAFAASPILQATAAPSPASSVDLSHGQADGVQLDPRTDSFTCGNYDITLLWRKAPGTIGIIWEADAKSRRSGREFRAAVKEVDHDAGAEAVRGARIVQTQMSDSMYLQTVYATCTRRGVYYVVSELLEGKSVGAKIADGSYDNNDAAIRGHFFQVVDGLSYMHSKGYTHNDVKPGNLVMDNKDMRRTTLKLVDFDDVGPITARSICGTRAIMGPEATSGSSRTDAQRNDVWEAGYTLLWMINKEQPWEGPNDHVARKIWPLDKPEKRVAALKKYFPKLSTDAANLLANVFTTQDQRLSASQFRQSVLATHRYFTSQRQKRAPEVESTGSIEGDEGAACFMLGSNSTMSAFRG